MKEVLIVEDKEEYRKLMAHLVKEVKPDVTVYETYDENEAYVIAIKRTIDLFIVDIILHSDRTGGDASGADFVRDIRGVEKYAFTPIIIASRLYDPKMNMYSTTNCYKVIEKPIDEQLFKKTVDEAIKYDTSEKGIKYVYFHKNGVLEAVSAEDILYAESRNARLVVHTKMESFTIPHRTCSRMLKEIGSDDFVMCNRSTIVNVNYIKSIDTVNRYILLAGSRQIIDIGISMKKQFLEELGKRGKLV